MKIEELNFSKKKLCIIASIILVPLLILGVIKLTPTNRNLNKLKNYSNKIHEYNLTLENSLEENNSISSNETQSILKTNIQELSLIKEELTLLETPKKNIPAKEKLLEIINYNIKLHEITLSVFNNPNSSNLAEVLSQYNKTLENLNTSYEDLKSLGINIDYKSYKNAFYTKVASYTNSLIKINRENDIKKSQKNNYVSSLQDCINELDTMNEDLRPALYKIREDGRSLDILLVDVKEKRAKYAEIESKSYTISVPEKGQDSYEKFRSSLKLYNLYISSLEKSIISEKNSTENNSPENNPAIQEENYNNSFAKYDDFILSFKELKDEVENFNKK